MKRATKWMVISLLGVFVILQFLHSSLISVHTNVDRRKCEAFLAEIESALSRFQIDHGYYPRHIGQSIDGAAILYIALAKGDRNYLKVSEKSDFVTVINGQTRLIDYWGDPLHYRSVPAEPPTDQQATKNPTYDLWSTGGSPKNREKWITNWRN